MEELQSTEALDREILEDARKKAFKILKNADETLASSKTAWENKLKRAEEKIRAQYAGKEAQIHREIMARLPMDKRRIRSETIDRFLNEAMNDFLRSLDRPSMLRMLKKELELRVTDDLSGAAELRYRLLSAEETKSLAASFGKNVSCTYIEDPLFTIAGSFPAMVIDFPRLRITVSADKAAEALLLEKRGELTEALLGDIEDLALPTDSAPRGSTAGGENG